MPGFRGTRSRRRAVHAKAVRGSGLDETQGTKSGEPGRPQGSGDQPRLTNLAVVAGGIVLIGLVAFALYRRSHPPSPPPVAGAAPAQAGEPAAPEKGTPIAAQIPIHLTPEASVIAERYRCVCSCNDPLNVCTCSKTPGSRDMRQYVQELVNEKKSGKEIDAAMMSRYGPTVLIATPSPQPSPAPARTRTKKR